MKKSLLLNSFRVDKILFFILFITFLIKSINGYLRWDLNEQIAMVDNFILDGDFYPTDENPYSTVSIYPMGVRLISLFFYNIGINESLINFMLFTAAVILFVTFNLLIKHSYNGEKINQSIVPISISFTLICCSFFVFYSTEFKPDTISFLLCFLGLILYFKNTKLIILSSILIGSSVLFKQQSIAFIIGLWIYTFIFFKHPIKYLSILSSIIYFLLFFYLFSDNQIKTYSFDVISDDGIKPLIAIFEDIYITLENLLIFVVFYLYAVESKINLNEIKNLFFELYKNPFTYISMSILGVSFLGSIKNGGNYGNIEVGLFFFLPVLIVVFQKFKINYFKSVIICAICFFMSASQLLQPIKSIFETNKLIETINVYNKKNKIENILIDSNSYSIVRDLRIKGSLIDNFNTPKLLDENFELNKLNWECYDLVITNKVSYDIIEESKLNGFTRLQETNNFSILIPKN